MVKLRSLNINGTKVIIQRKKYLDLLMEYKDKRVVKIITGMRRCGKSEVLKSYYFALIEKGIKEEQIIYLQIEDTERYNFKSHEQLSEYVYSKMRNDIKYYVMIDEIQNIDEWHKTILSLSNKENVDIYITGSNSKLLSSEFSTFLTGRTVQIKIFPLSFEEYYKTMLPIENKNIEYF
jgi:predicted AAA+ superfamily ATPase